MEIIEKQKGLGIHQVPITTKPPLTKYYTIFQLLAVTKIKEKSLYKPESWYSKCFKAVGS